jgi:hypothetical protein
MTHFMSNPLSQWVSKSKAVVAGQLYSSSSDPNWIVQDEHHCSGLVKEPLTMITAFARAVLREEVGATEPPGSSLGWEITHRIFKSKPDASLHKNPQARPPKPATQSPKTHSKDDDFSPRIAFSTLDDEVAPNSSVFSGLRSCTDDSER